MSTGIQVKFSNWSNKIILGERNNIFFSRENLIVLSDPGYQPLQRGNSLQKSDILSVDVRF